MANAPIVRPATAADHDAWLALWRGYQAFYEVRQPEAATRVTWERLLDPAEPIHLALAVHGANVVGMAHFIEHRSSFTAGNSVYLQDLFTVPSARGKGVGRALIAHVVARAKALGCVKVHWLTHETNTVAMALYDKVAERPGFVQYRIVF